MRLSLVSVVLVVLAALCVSRVEAQLPSGSVKTVGTAHSHVLSLPLTQMTTCIRAAGSDAKAEAPPVKSTSDKNALSAPIVSFEGLHLGELQPHAGCILDGFASDNSGAVGPNHYVQVVNTAIVVFDKAGNIQAGPIGSTEFWYQQPDCGGEYYWSDMVVAYDRHADRWVVSRPGGAHAGQDLCLAISRTSDPTGSYDQYAFVVNNEANGLFNFFNDYPKISTFGDAYYATANPNKIFSGLGNTVSAFDRKAMLAGDAAPTFVTWFIPAPQTPVTRSHMLAADQDGDKRPPHGSPEYIVQVQDSHLGFPAGRLQVYEFRVDWSSPSSSTLVPTTSLTPEPFNSSACEEDECIKQPGTGLLLDSVSYGYMMYRLSYRNFGDHQTLLFNHTVAADGNPSHNHAGIRWYELRKWWGLVPWKIHQQGTHAPDANNRWLGSIAMDREGNIALGFNIAGNGYFPSLRYVGRRAYDPLGTLPLGEISMAEGNGVQQDYEEFGDYSQMTIDPTDDCTFWYTGTYYPATTRPNDWHTRIVSFRFRNCHGRDHAWDD